jgi:ABC-type multidrug transport system fused ATPase/permease subunit
MKLIKMSGITGPVQSHIQELRVTEIAMGGQWRTLLGIVATLSHVPMAISPVMTFAVSSRTQDTTTIFVSISYLTLLAAPLMIVFQKLPQLLGALTCLRRIQDFLEQDVRLDGRRFLQESEIVHRLKDSDNIEMAAWSGSNEAAVSVVKGHFAWNEETTVLGDVSFVVPRSQVVTILGPVASGKTTLCKALLGELPIANGAISLRHRGRIGYCSQQPFLTNDTVQNNIVGFESYDHERYMNILKATMLDRDIETFTDGDQTRIGSGAITLSGGQKQRLAIARALYVKETELLIFDDVLSGLDMKTEQHVLEHVFGSQGVLRRRKVTVLLCTHKARHIELADQVFRIRNGTIITHETGKLPEITDDATGTQSQSEESNLPKTVPPHASVNKDDETRRLGDFTVYGHYLRTVGTIPVAVCLFGAMCHGFLINFPKVWLTFWSDDRSRPDPANSQAYYIGIYGLLETLYIGSFVVVGMTVLLVFIRVSGAVLHQTALETVITAPLRLFTQTDVGTITNYFAQDMTLIDGEMPLALLNLILDTFGVIGMAALLASSAPWLALAYPAMCVILWLIQSFYLKTSRQLRLLDLEAKAPLYSHFIETLNGLATIRAFGWEEDSKEHGRMLLDRSQKPQYLLAVVQRWLFFVLNMVVTVVATLLVTLITQLSGTSSSLSGASLVTLMSLSSALSDIVRFYAMLETSIGAVARLRNFSTSTGSEKKPQHVFQPDSQWPSRGAVTLEHINASYDEAGAQLALRDVSVDIKPGENLALCGRTGR